MSLKSKIEAVIYASEEPVTLAQLVVLLSEEAQAELDALAARQAELPLESSVERLDADPEGHGRDSAAHQTGSESEDVLDTNAIGEVEATDSAGITPKPKSAGEDMEEATGLAADAPPEGGEAEPAAPTDVDKRQARERERAIRDYLRGIVDTLIREYADSDRGLEVREVAGGFRFGTKPEYHDAVRGFVKNLKPALKLSLQALETLAVVAYKQPVTAAEISEIRGVDSAGVLGGLLTRKLIQTAGRKQVIGRPMLYKTSKEFLVRFGLRDIQELPSMEEFERMAGELNEQEDLPMDATESVIERANARGDAEHIRETNQAASSEGDDASPVEEAGAVPGGNGADADTSDVSVEEDGESGIGDASETRSVSADVESSPRSEVTPEASSEAPGQTEEDRS